MAVNPRFEELKIIGFVNLNKAQKEEYMRLKKEQEVGDESNVFDGVESEPEKEKPQEEVVEPPVEQDKITISKVELERLIAAQIEEATNRVRDERSSVRALDSEWKPREPEKKKFYTATLRKYRPDSSSEWKYIVDWKFLKNVWDEKSRNHDKQIYLVTLRDEKGGVEVIEMDIMNFATNENMEMETVTILHMEKKELEKIHGYVRKKKIDKEDYVWGNIETSEKVPLSEIREEMIATIQFKDGKTLTLNANRLNA